VHCWHLDGGDVRRVSLVAGRGRVGNSRG